MSKNEKNTLWSAQPHTLAKISILKAYLSRWFEILGRSKPKQELWYIDGFAGPGEYTNAPSGSPIAAIFSARDALASVKASWVAGDIHCVFIEQDEKRFQHLRNRIDMIKVDPRIKIHFLNRSFVDGLAELKAQRANPFASSSPLFAFIDPFGAKGVPFSEVKELLSRGACEVLINFDSDGVGRIYRAKEAANYKAILNDVFGDDSWELEFEKHQDTHELYRGVLSLYKQKLRALPNVRYVFAFEMRSPKDTIDYHLVFASQHPLGLEKMKEAMKTIAKNGDFCFSDAHIKQTSLFRFDEPEMHSAQLHEQFRGQTVDYETLNDYALNESPFTNPKSMLRDLEKKEKIQTFSNDPKRRKFTFNEEKLIAIEFLTGDSHDKENKNRMD